VAVYMVYTAKGGSIQQKEVQLLQSEAVYMVYTVYSQRRFYTAKGGTTAAV